MGIVVATRRACREINRISIIHVNTPPNPTLELGPMELCATPGYEHRRGSISLFHAVMTPRVDDA